MKREGRSPITALLIAALLAAACSDRDSGHGAKPRSGSAVASTPKRVEFVRLRAVTDGESDGDTRVVQRIEVPEDIAGWKTRRAEITVVPAEEGSGLERRLEIRSEERHRVIVPGPFEPWKFNRVVVELQLGHRQAVALDFMKSRKVVASSPTRAIVPGDALIQFELPELGWIESNVDQIALSFSGPVRRGRLGWIELQHAPTLALLPSADRPDLTRVGAEHRRCVGMSTRRSIEADFDTTADGRLRFAYASRTPLPPGERAQLFLQLDGENGVSERHLVDPGKSPPSHWRRASVPLAPFEGQRVTARWEIQSNAEEEVVYALSVPQVLAKEEIRRPNVLLITSDTHRADHLGSAGRGVKVSTPVIDALAESGVLFEDCFSSTNVTNPSHIALMTATHPRDTGVLSNDTAVVREARTLAEAFRQAGYVGYAAVSVRHLGHGTSGIGQGFERMSVPDSKAIRDGGETVDVMERWIRNADGAPLFVWLHVFDAHMPYDPPEEYAEKYYGDRERAFDGSRSLPLPEGFMDETHPYFRGLTDIEYPSAMYRGEIDSMDSELRRILDMPEMEDAVIGFTADHGESLGQHGIYYAHSGLYPDTVHVPLVIKAHGAPAGVRSSYPVRQIDLGRTLLDLSGNTAIGFPGRNLIDVLEADRPPSDPRFCVAAHAHAASITWNGWHLMLRRRAHTAQRTRPVDRHSVELYQLRDDPDCEANLLDQEFELATRLRAELLRWLASVDDRGWSAGASSEEELVRQLEALGYTAGDDGSVGLDFDIEDCECEWCARFPD